MSLSAGRTALPASTRCRPQHGRTPPTRHLRRSNPMSIATDVRAYADLALEQGKNVLSQAGAAVSTANKRLAADAPKPVLAALGVADLVATTVAKQADLLG